MSEEELNQMSNNELIGIIKAQKFEIEQLEKQLQTTANNCKQLENIRKEVIEYINNEIFKRTILVGVGTKKYTRNILDNILNILNKGE